MKKLLLSLLLLSSLSCLSQKMYTANDIGYYKDSIRKDIDVYGYFFEVKDSSYIKIMTKTDTSLFVSIKNIDRTWNNGCYYTFWRSSYKGKSTIVMYTHRDGQLIGFAIGSPKELVSISLKQINYSVNNL